MMCDGSPRLWRLRWLQGLQKPCSGELSARLLQKEKRPSECDFARYSVAGVDRPGELWAVAMATKGVQTPKQKTKSPRYGPVLGPPHTSSQPPDARSNITLVLH